MFIAIPAYYLGNTEGIALWRKADRWLKRLALVVLLLVVFAAGWLMARTGMGSAIDPATLPAVEREFVEKMNGAALVGRFTMSRPRRSRGDAGSLRPVQRGQGGPDQWRFNAKIGESGVTVPVVVPDDICR